MKQIFKIHINKNSHNHVFTKTQKDKKTKSQKHIRCVTTDSVDFDFGGIYVTNLDVFTNLQVYFTLFM